MHRSPSPPPQTPLHSTPLSAFLYSSDRASWKINLWKEKEKKNYKCSYSPTPAAQFCGLRRAGGSGVCDNCQGEEVAITKGHPPPTLPNVTLKGKRSGHEAAIVPSNAPRYAPIFSPPFHSRPFSLSNYR